jgi:hypothetical protein
MYLVVKQFDSFMITKLDFFRKILLRTSGCDSRGKLVLNVETDTCAAVSLHVVTIGAM